MPRSDSNPKIQIQRLVFNGQFTSLLDSSPIREQLYYIVTPRQKKKKMGASGASRWAVRLEASMLESHHGVSSLPSTLIISSGPCKMSNPALETAIKKNFFTKS